MKKNLTRIVVTGMGVLSPLGEDVKTYWSSLLEGKSGIAPMKLADSTEYPCKISGEVSDFDPKNYMDLKEARRMARFSQLAVASAGLAIKDAKLNISKMDPGSIGVLLGNGNGGFPTTEENARILFSRGGMKVSPFFIPMVLPNMAAANVSRIYSIKGYTSTVITACAAGTQAIGEAAEVIRRGTADVIITGGCEAGISQLGLGGFNVIKALTRNNENPEKASRPFDANRDGFAPAEGSATLILESLEHANKRGANIVAEIIGYGVSSDAYHLVQPDEEASGPARAMQWALDNASISSNQVDYINAHGTSTPKNDLVETKAIKKVFEKNAYNIPISSTKSMIGHALGGAGALEAVACIKTILSKTIHPTINYETPDPECDLDYVPNKSRISNVDIAMSNSFGFGGQNACVIFSRYNE
ncbi:MAG: beta-ketoacyl-[acyl-carrier-protein] synthase II [Chloroflexi bacterium]|nr:beta-ketoacyl-[acyl-carrier-protein] synthase II [Chloroflexota bacterium]|tara:strand:- start:15736 stop:16986 length:1251 start_codon:yes stop_codon:yes gene_type:complete